jgi:ABC-2 type transport system permease protein
MPPPTPPAHQPPKSRHSLSQHQALRLIFLTLFLRGRGARGLKRDTVPKSIAQKLAITLVFYTVAGCLAAALRGQPIFSLAAYLHAMTFIFLGMFVAASAGEILFNKDEADILLHRPVSASALLWAKVRVLVEVSLWVAAAINLVGLYIGTIAPDGGWRFPLIHAISICLESIFCTSFVVMIYQLCLRWFGRERLEGLMTATQVIVAIAVVLSGQILPQMIGHTRTVATLSTGAWWMFFLPPAWFAGFDDAFAGAASIRSLALAAIALVATAAVIYFAYSKLAQDYATGLQTIAESAPSPRTKRTGRRWIDTLVSIPPLSWWLRDPVERAAFLLAAAYLLRDRDIKLRVYPGIAPLLAMPIIMLVRGRSSGPFGISFCAALIGIIPMFGIATLQYSQQWLASDIFHAAPLPGPGRIIHGARRAVLCFLAFPLIVLFALIVRFAYHDSTQLLSLLPGIISLPLFALAPNLGGGSMMLSLPVDEAKSTRRGMTMMLAMLCSMAIAGVATFARTAGYFTWFLLAEAVISLAVYLILRRSITLSRWPELE